MVAQSGIQNICKGYFMNTIIAVAGILFGIYISRQAMKFRTSKQQLYLGYAAIWLFALGFYWELIASWKDISTTPEMAFLSGFGTALIKRLCSCVSFLPFWTALCLCVFIENSYWKEGETAEQRKKRRDLKFKRFLRFGLFLLLIDGIYIWFRWDLLQKFLDAYCWLRSLL